MYNAKDDVKEIKKIYGYAQLLRTLCIDYGKVLKQHDAAYKSMELSESDYKNMMQRTFLASYSGMPPTR